MEQWRGQKYPWEPLIHSLATGRRWAGLSTRALVFLWSCLMCLWLQHSTVTPSGFGVHLLHTNLVVLLAFLACSRWLCHCLLPLRTSEMASLVFSCVYHETSSVCRVPYSGDAGAFPFTLIMGREESQVNTSHGYVVVFSEACLL